MEDLSRDLFEAAEKGAVELFQQSLGGAEQFSAARRLRNEDGRSLLHVASASGHARVILLGRFLLHCGFSRSYKPSDLVPVKQIVSLLADGADPAETGVNACDEEGWTPLISAVSSGRGAAVEALLRAGQWTEQLQHESPVFLSRNMNLLSKLTLEIATSGTNMVSSGCTLILTDCCRDQ